MFCSIKNYVYFNRIIRNHQFIENRIDVNIQPTQSTTIVNRLLLTQRNLDFNCSDNGNISVFSRLREPYIYRKLFNKKDKLKALEFCQALLSKAHKVLITPYSNFSLVKYVIDEINDFDSFWESCIKKHSLITMELYQEGDPFKIFFKGKKYMEYML